MLDNWYNIIPMSAHDTVRLVTTCLWQLSLHTPMSGNIYPCQHMTQVTTCQFASRQHHLLTLSGDMSLECSGHVHSCTGCFMLLSIIVINYTREQDIIRLDIKIVILNTLIKWRNNQLQTTEHFKLLVRNHMFSHFQRCFKQLFKKMNQSLTEIITL